jgi:hypothetical protein
MSEPAQVNGIRGVLVMCGLGTPLARAFVAGTVVGIVAFAAGLPKSAFTEDGQLRPQAGLSNDPEACDYHFLVVPLSVALAVGLFT